MTLLKQPDLKNLNLELNNTLDTPNNCRYLSGIRIGCHLTGLHTPKIKETDRPEALRIELTNWERIFR
jgi:3-phosphoshikimate 1-carboxyvinyltransferase